MSPLFAFAWQASLAGLLLTALVLALWLLSHRHRARSNGGAFRLGSLRERLRSTARRAVERRRPGYLRIDTGAWVHLHPVSPPSEKELMRGIELARRDIGPEELVQLSLSDLLASDHPATASFYAIADVEPSVLPPEAVRFTIAPGILSKEVQRAFEGAGLELAPARAQEKADRTATLGTPHDATPRVRAFGQELTFSPATLMAEAAATATPIESLALDEASRLKVELYAIASSANDARDAPRNGDAGLDVTEATPGADRFRGRFFKVADNSGRPTAWVIVGAGAASIAQHPDLLAGASKAVDGPPAGARVRVYAYREDVLAIALEGTSSALLAACRKRAGLYLYLTSRHVTAPLHIDITTNLGLRATGTFDLSPIDERFFDAARGAENARLQCNLPGAATARAMTRLALDDLPGARAHLEEASCMAPENGEILLALGTLLNEIGDHEAAAKALRRAVGLDLENPATNNNLGVAYQGLGRLAEAQLFFEKAASIRPEDSVSRVNLGRARLDSGDAFGAEHSFLDALACDPRCVSALAGLVLVALREGDHLLARDRLGTALGIAPTDAGLLRLHQALYPDEQAH